MQQRGLFFRCRWAVWLVVFSSWAGAGARGDEPALRGGLIGRFSQEATGAESFWRVDADVLFDWQTGSPDLRIGNGAFSAVWNGLLFVRTEGTHRLHLHLEGRASVTLNGKVLFEQVDGQNGWVDSEPIPLEYGYSPIEIHYTKTGLRARIGMYWSSDAFAIEPITERYLFHRPPKEGSAAVGADLFDRGRQIVDAYRCFACHEGPSQLAPPKAPSLIAVDQYWFDRGWVEKHVRSPSQLDPNSKMPSFSLTADEAADVTEYFFKNSEPISYAGLNNDGNVDAGRDLFRSVGCLACHKVAGSGQGGLYAGLDLTHIGHKRTTGSLREWFVSWHPPERRMPSFQFNQKQNHDMGAYLASLKKKKGPLPGTQRKKYVPDFAKGWDHVNRFQCSSCHQIRQSGRMPDMTLRKIPSVGGDWGKSCLAPLDEKKKHRPHYDLSAEERLALQAFFEQLPSHPGELAVYEMGRMAMQRRNCLACHRRERSDGLLGVVGQMVEESEGIAPEDLPAFVPPSLNTVGDKLTDQELNEAVVGGRTSWRPWLRVQMPKFAHDEKEKAAIVTYLKSHDRVPARDAESIELPGSDQLQLAGHTLVGPSGFGCMTCHIVGDHWPSGIGAGARGTDLRHVGRRIRHEWYRRWLENPARIMPGTEMPTVDTAVPNLLNGHLEHQIEALWHALNAESFSLPTGEAVQLLTAQAGDPPIILRDCFEHDRKSAQRTVRSFAVGFGNRQNVLYDLDSLTLVKWWIGDFAREKTRGKTWYWQVAGIELLQSDAKVASFALKVGDRLLAPTATRSTVTKLHDFRSRQNRVTFSYGLEFEGGRSITVTEILTPLASSGFARILWTRNVPERSTLLCVVPASQPALKLAGPYQLGADTEVGPIEINLPSGQKWERIDKPDFAPDAGGVYVAGFTENPRTEGLRTCRVYYIGPEAPTVSSSIKSPYDQAEQKTLDVIPGYEVTRLPLNDEVMPTAMTWRSDGTLVVASLKGRVFLAKDGDGDGIEDRWSAYSHHLASPFGLLADGKDILVAHKPELLRLIDADGDDFAERAEVVATGWGYTFDYHDWTIGPVRDREGNLYVNTGVQQDDRPLDATYLRGRTLKITPGGKLLEVARGHRFAMGIAMDADGQLFTTDQQGMQNPYNEINHVRPGLFFGFPNKLDPDRQALPTETPPAIKAPHPWSRSINGITFIPNNTAFGPFGGHLLGAELDTRRIVRFSFQKVGDTFQGATYPFSLIVRDKSEDNFLGPVSLAFSPKGDLYVGSLLDSGWGGGNNRGEMCKIEYVGPVPVGIREVRAHRSGFTIDFTQIVDSPKAADAKSYTLTAATRTFRGSYASPDQDITPIAISNVRLSDHNRTVTFDAKPLKEGYLYEIHVANLTDDGSTFFPAEAFYTLNQIPVDSSQK